MGRYKFLLCVVFGSMARFLFADDPRGDTINLYSYQLRIDLRDFDHHILYATAGIKMYAKANNVHGISFNLQKLTVDSVKENGIAVPFSYDDSLLSIQFSHALNKGDSAALLIYYHGNPKGLPNDFGGFYWNDKYAYNIGVSFVSSPHSYGRTWFPCFDNFTVRSHYEFFITTRKTDKAFCNGLLVDSKTDSTGTTWHWKLNEDIPAYLASVAVAGYQTLNDTIDGINGIVPVQIAALPEDTAAVARRFKHLHQAFHILEHYWGPYRWERVGYCIVPFNAGAMEHATNISFMQYYLNAYKKNCETIIAHELSHHWFGNMVTCASEGDMWLNEGWASYSESLFIEGLYGADSARLYRRNNHTKDVESAHNDDNGYWPLSGVPTEYTYGNTVYDKGADVIQTLRYYLGDSVFFSCVKSYLYHYAFSSAGTTQMRDYLSACSGRDLTGFFNDWIMSPGYPQFSISSKYIKHVKGKYEVYVNIRQRLSHAPGLYNGVPVTISYFNSDMKRKDEIIFVNGENTTYATTLNFKPVAIIPDFNENLAEAITRQWQVIKDTGFYQFDNVDVAVKVQSVGDSALIWIGQNLLPADPMAKILKGLHLNNVRYWTVDGVFNTGLRATGFFEYDGAPYDKLEGSFINSEDSLMMMYRPDEVTDWKPVNQFYIDKGENDSDGVGAIVVYPLLKGDYAVATYNSKTQVETRPLNELTRLDKAVKDGFNFKMHLDTASKSLMIAFEKNTFDHVDITNQFDKKIAGWKIDNTAKEMNLEWYPSAVETYVVTLTTKTGKGISKKLTN